jgi:hypothetical protein
MVERRDDAHMGCVTRQADMWSADVIAYARDEMKRKGGDGLAERKLAFVLGSLTHRAADRLTKPITNCWSGAPDAGPAGGDANESKIVQDLFVFKEVFCSGHGEAATPFTPDVIGGWTTEAEAAFERLYQLMLRRALIAMHTFNPDSSDIHSWFQKFFSGLQTFPKSLSQYAELAANWDEAIVKKYLIDKRFYCRDDALIRLARHVQRGSTVSSNEVQQAHATTDSSHSRYARALAKALDYLLAAGALYCGKIDVNEAKVRFDVGVPELSIQD